jgi:predicted nucleic acid-binding protein
VNAILDTSVLLAPGALERLPGEAAVSVITLGELHFGVARATDPERRAERAVLLGTVESLFAPLPVTPAIARIWGLLCGAAVERGLRPRRRTADLLIAATARAHRVRLYTCDRDLAPFDDLVDLRIVAQSSPGQGG